MINPVDETKLSIYRKPVNLKSILIYLGYQVYNISQTPIQ